MKTKTFKAQTAHRLIVIGESVLNLVWGAADARRAAALEIIARTAYTAEESACHFLETIGYDSDGHIRQTLELARWQDTNEQMHEDVFGRDLGGLDGWFDQFLSRHVAFVIYWVFAILTLVNHEFAALLGEAVEVEAVKTYARMLHEQPAEWLNQPAPRGALEYWAKPNTLWSVRGEPKPQTMRDVVEYIRRDEADHIENNSAKALAF
ncbi:plastoquinol terminal oxidase [Synechococcus phage S-N03]|uniref:Plastoquinol terminal oxidase n=1 Tax=Synechococcus phage S-N03 TaxID=2718943 RepID=A0A6G8R5T6_9CAUD|nr:plastoquinol terminal oxidase [Synechococcus phage S-N03]QIN96765.1 plastoquinol terminal oxidase [Synechococcus phage S-N03]